MQGWQAGQRESEMGAGGGEEEGRRDKDGDRTQDTDKREKKYREQDKGTEK